jgi:toxin FitB
VSFLLDTNVVSELRKRSPNPNVLAWHHAHAQTEVFLSVLVLGELRQGVERLRPRDSTQAEALDPWISGLVRAYSDRILPVSVEVADAWGRLNASVGPPTVDGLLAATALVHRLTLVTRNAADVARTGVAVVNPFEVP